MKRTVKLAEFKCRSNSSFSYTDQKSVPIDCMDCYVLRTPAILPDIRILRSLRFTFMFISGRVPRSFSHHCASTGGIRPFDTVILTSLCLKNRMQQNNLQVFLLYESFLRFHLPLIIILLNEVFRCSYIPLRSHVLPCHEYK